jgi:hypothetical protein
VCSGKFCYDLCHDQERISWSRIKNAFIFTRDVEGHKKWLGEEKKIVGAYFKFGEVIEAMEN